MAAAVPHWDKKDRQLFLRKALVKEYPRPAPNQELILQAFEEQAWAAEIDDPLPHEAGINPKRRLHDAIKQLNLHQQGKQRIRFHGVRQGRGISWEPDRRRTKRRRKK